MGLFPRQFDAGEPMSPIAQPGDNLVLQKGQQGFDLYSVVYVESLPRSAPISINAIGLPPVAAGTTLAAGASTTGHVSLDGQWDMQSGQLAQLRFRVIDNITVALFNPQQLGEGVTLNQQALITPFGRFNDPNDAMTEQYIFEQYRLYVSVTNRWANQALSMARLIAYGFRYVLGGGTQGQPELGNSQKSLPPIQHFDTLRQLQGAPGPRGGPLKYTLVRTIGWGG